MKTVKFSNHAFQNLDHEIPRNPSAFFWDENLNKNLEEEFTSLWKNARCLPTRTEKMLALLVCLVLLHPDFPLSVPLPRDAKEKKVRGDISPGKGRWPKKDGHLRRRSERLCSPLPCWPGFWKIRSPPGVPRQGCSLSPRSERDAAASLECSPGREREKWSIANLSRVQVGPFA